MGYWSPYKVELSRQKFYQSVNITGSILAGTTQTRTYAGVGLIKYIAMGGSHSSLTFHVEVDGEGLFGGANLGVGSYNNMGWKPAGSYVSVEEYNLNGQGLMCHRFPDGLPFKEDVEVVFVNGTAAAIDLTFVIWLECDNVTASYSVV